jgi:hypothetical protein
MPFTPQYAYPVTSSADIGYNYTKKYDGGFATGAGTTNIMSLAIPSPGIWLVEGQVNCYVTNETDAWYLYWSLTTVDGTSIDYSRINYIWIDQISGSQAANRMSSVFVVNDTTTTIYMNVNFPSGECDHETNGCFITYTRLA